MSAAGLKPRKTRPLAIKWRRLAAASSKPDHQQLHQQGAGIAPSSRPGPFGTGAGQEIGIPAVAVSGGRFVTEAHLRAGEPITLSLSAGGCMDNRCSVNTPLCTASRSIVPQASQDYVATILSRGPECEVDVSRIVIQQGRTRLTAEQTSPASRCAASN